MQQSANRLLASLPAAEYAEISRHLRTVRVEAEGVLPHCGTTRVYFPGTGFCSIGARMADGRYLEVASVGSAGVVGIPALAAQLSSPPVYAHVTPGVVDYLTITAFEAARAHSGLRHATDDFCGSFVRSLMQLGACAKQHSVERRCARWILMAHDALGRARFEVTQAFLARAIGATSLEISSVVALMRARGVLRHDKMSVTVIDAIGLQRMACECYPILKVLAQPPPAARERRVKRRPARIVPFRQASECLLCGLHSSQPHKTHAECLHALSLEMSEHFRRVRHLSRTRARILDEYFAKYAKFLRRRKS